MLCGDLLALFGADDLALQLVVAVFLGQALHEGSILFRHVLTFGPKPVFSRWEESAHVAVKEDRFLLLRVVELQRLELCARQGPPPFPCEVSSGLFATHRDAEVRDRPFGANERAVHGGTAPQPGHDLMDFLRQYRATGFLHHASLLASAGF